MRNSGDAQRIEIGWWPGDHRYLRAAFYAYAHPAPEGFASAACQLDGRPRARVRDECDQQSPRTR
jgi:hypothetical protein